MKLILATLLVTVVIGFLMRGRLSNLSRLRLRWAPLALVGFSMQLINPPGRWPLFMLLGSFVLLTIFAVANIKTAGFALIMIGVAMNFTVIAVNGGMPVARQALIASGQVDTLSDLVNSADGYVKHHLADADDRVVFLADVIALPAPISQAISLGDIYTYGGVLVVIVAAMRRRVEDEDAEAATSLPAAIAPHPSPVAGEAHGARG